MPTHAHWPALSVVLIVLWGHPRPTLACPHPCTCYVPSEVHCTFRSLASVPAGISKHVERINLGFVPHSYRTISASLLACLFVSYMYVHWRKCECIFPSVSLFLALHTLICAESGLMHISYTTCSPSGVVIWICPSTAATKFNNRALWATSVCPEKSLDNNYFPDSRYERKYRTQT